MADNITVSRGTGDEVHWPLFDDAGAPITDFTGWTAKSQVRTYFGVVTDDPDTEEVESNLLHEFDYRFDDEGIYLVYTAAETQAWEFLRGVGDIKVFKSGVQAQRPIRFYLWVSQTATE